MQMFVYTNLIHHSASSADPHYALFDWVTPEQVIYFPCGHAIQRGDIWLISSHAFNVVDVLRCVSPLISKFNI